MVVKELKIRYNVRKDLPRVRSQAALVSSPKEAARFFSRVLSDETIEVFALLCLTTKHRGIAYHEVSRGTIDSTLVHPRDVFKAAILSNSAALILAHNHPSGEPEPSKEDKALTTRLVNAGKLLGIEILDHIIVGQERYYSFKEGGLI